MSNIYPLGCQTYRTTNLQLHWSEEQIMYVFPGSVQTFFYTCVNVTGAPF